MSNVVVYCIGCVGNNWKLNTSLSIRLLFFVFSLLFSHSFSCHSLFSYYSSSIRFHLLSNLIEKRERKISSKVVLKTHNFWMGYSCIVLPNHLHFIQIVWWKSTSGKSFVSRQTNNEWKSKGFYGVNLFECVFSIVTVPFSLLILTDTMATKANGDDVGMNQWWHWRIIAIVFH